MLDPITPPPGTTPELAVHLARFRLSVSEAADVLGVSRQLAHIWSTAGKRTESGEFFLVGLKPTPSSRLHLSPEGVALFAERVGITPDFTKLRLNAQRTLGVGHWANGDTPATFDFDEVIAEAEAARQLGLSEGALRRRRKLHKLSPVLLAGLRKGGGDPLRVGYSQQAVWAEAAGKLEEVQ